MLKANNRPLEGSESMIDTLHADGCLTAAFLFSLQTLTAAVAAADHATR